MCFWVRVCILFDGESIMCMCESIYVGLHVYVCAKPT